MQQELRSDWIFDDVWCGGAALYLETVEHQTLPPGTSPCAIITVPISHEDAHNIVKDATFDEQNKELKEWALNDADNAPFREVLDRQKQLVSEMQMFTPWPDQQCDACSVSQCSEDNPKGRCCWINEAEFATVNTSCSLSLGIADSHDITQVVSPVFDAKITNRSLYSTQTSLGATADQLFNRMKSS